jgi:hypothetical protein
LPAPNNLIAWVAHVVASHSRSFGLVPSAELGFDGMNTLPVMQKSGNRFDLQLKPGLSPGLNPLKTWFLREKPAKVSSKICKPNRFIDKNLPKTCLKPELNPV